MSANSRKKGDPTHRAASGATRRLRTAIAYDCSIGISVLCDDKLDGVECPSDVARGYLSHEMEHIGTLGDKVPASGQKTTYEAPREPKKRPMFLDTYQVDDEDIGANLGAAQRQSRQNDPLCEEPWAQDVRKANPEDITARLQAEVDFRPCHQSLSAAFQQQLNKRKKKKTRHGFP